MLRVTHTYMIRNLLLYDIVRVRSSKYSRIITVNYCYFIEETNDNKTITLLIILFCFETYI